SSYPRRLKKQQGRLNTRVKFEPAQPSQVGQFSAGANTPCHIEGTMKRNGEACDWKIRPGATGSIRCREKTEYFVCDTCTDLFGN
ncbi:hypothetical protein WKW79_00005, partial [Variovorax robiniae]